MGRYPNYNTNPIDPDQNGMGSTAQQIAERIKLGWNLGNTMEAFIYDNDLGQYVTFNDGGWENSWGNASATPALMQSVKQAGFDAVRLPISWNIYADPNTAKIDNDWLQHVDDVVQMVIDADMYVLVNIHWDHGWLEENVNPQSQEAINDRQHALWTQIATQLRDYDERLMFASANEPHVDDATQMAVLLSYHQTFVDAVRATGGKNAYRTLVVQGPSTSAEKTFNLMHNLPNDSAQDRMMVEFHTYTPYQFTLLSEDVNWGKMFFYWGQGNHSPSDTGRNPTWGEESEIDKEINWMRDKFVNQGIPVILGEYAAMDRRDQVPTSERDRHKASRNQWNGYVTRKAIENGIVPFYWDAGNYEKFGTGLFDRDYETANDANHATLLDVETMNVLKQAAGK